jgi:hypothetical protein
MKQRRQYAPQGQVQRIAKAVTHIRLIEANPGKLAALDALAPAYLALCQQKAVKALLMQRHEVWKTQNGWP